MLHLRFCQFYKGQLHQNPLLAGISDLAGQPGEYPDIPHQGFSVCQLCIFFQFFLVVCRHIQNPFHIVCSLYQQQISHVPDKIIDKLSQFPSLDDQVFQLVNTVRRLLLRHGAEHTAEYGSIHCSQNIQHMVIGQPFPDVKGHTLVQEA